MKFKEGREQVLAFLKEMEMEAAAKREGRVVSEGEYFAHVDVSVTVTYMGRVPIEYAVEGYVCTDQLQDLQPCVREAYSKIAGTNTVFKALDNECKRTEEGNHGEPREFDHDEEDDEEGRD